MLILSHLPPSRTHRRWLAATLLLVAACADDPDQDSEAPPTTGEKVEGDAWLDLELTSPDQLAVGGTPVSLIIHNRRDQDAETSILVTVISEQGVTKRHGVRHASVPAGDTRAVQLTLEDLNLPEAELASAGQVWITADTQFADGEHLAPSADTRYFHRTGREFALYDRKARDEVFNHGNFTQEVSSLSEREALGAIEANPSLTAPLAADVEERTSDDAHGEVHDERLEVLSGLLMLALTRPGSESLPKATISKRYCFELATTYDDIGIGEDYFTAAGATFRPARGIFWRSGGLSGFADSGGCTGPITSDVGFEYIFTFESRGNSGGHNITSRDTGATTGVAAVRALVDGAAVQTVRASPNDARFNAYVAAAYAANSHAGLGTGSINLVTGSDDNALRGDSIHLTTAGTRRKFTIAHEFGHFIQRDSAGDIAPDCSFSSVSCPASGSHHVRSKEHASCAFSEGFAWFYSGDVWNSHDQSDCFLRAYGTTTVNCGAGDAAIPTRFMETMCDPTYPGRGNETDWMRTFWDLHTDAANEVQPTMNQILRWMEDANDHGTAWTRTNSFTLLDAEADRKGGQLNIHWDINKTFYGIDW
jgi:hypothetical protein